jgi:hypothetical protein
MHQGGHLKIFFLSAVFWLFFVSAGQRWWVPGMATRRGHIPASHMHTNVYGKDMHKDKYTL